VPRRRVIKWLGRSDASGLTQTLTWLEAAWTARVAERADSTANAPSAMRRARQVGGAYDALGGWRGASGSCGVRVDSCVEACGGADDVHSCWWPAGICRECSDVVGEDAVGEDDVVALAV
jgi:hypothetical protein